MRQLTPHTNIVLTLVAAALLVVALGLPFYGAEPGSQPESAASIENTGSTLVRYFGTQGPTVSGSDALDAAETLLVGLAGLTAFLALLMLVPALRNGLRDVLKVVPLVAPLVMVVQVFSAPSGMEVRIGVFAALAVAAFMASSAFHAAELRAVPSGRRAASRA